MKNKKPYPLKTDTGIFYIVPMLNLKTKELDNVVSILIHRDGGFLTCFPAEPSDNYESYGFYDEYFQWLLYTGYVKIANI